MPTIHVKMSVCCGCACVTKPVLADVVLLYGVYLSLCEGLHMCLFVYGGCKILDMFVLSCFCASLCYAYL